MRYHLDNLVGKNAGDRTKPEPPSSFAVRVLVADDGLGALSALRPDLATLGAELIEVTSGRQVIQLLDDNDFAAILLDIAVPDIDGLEVAQIIRQHPRSRTTPILLVSGSADHEILDRAYRLGAVDYLQKPLVPVIVRAKVAGFIELERRAHMLRHQAEEIAALNAELQAEGEEQRRLHTRMLESMTEAVSLSEESGVIVYVNPAGERMFGYEPGELIGQHVTVQNAYPPEENRQLVESVIAQLQRDGIWEGEWHNRRKDGTPFFTRARIRAVELSGRKYWMCVQEDITARRYAEIARRASETRFHTAVRAVRGLLWTNNAAGQMEGEQPGWAAFTHQSYDEYQGYGWTSALHPEDVRPTLDAWEQAVAERRMFVFEHRVRRRDGMYRLFSIRALPVMDDSGTLREWVGVHTDITEERQLLETVRESEARFRDLADSAPVFIWISDANRQCIWLNRPWLEFTGRRLEQEVGYGWAERIHPTDRGRVIRTYNDAFDRLEPFETEYRARRHDGEWRWLLDQGIPRFLRDGVFAGFIGSCIDITERREREAQLSILSSIQHDLATLATADEITQVVSSRIGAHMGVKTCSFFDVNEARTEATADYTWNVEGVPSLRHTFRLGDYLTTAFQETCRRGQVFIVEDSRSDPRTNDAALKAINVRSFVIVPFLREGVWRAYLAITDTEPRKWRQEEIGLVQDLANRIFPRLERIRSEAALRQSEERLRRAMEIDTVAVIFFNLEGEITHANDAFLRMSGYSSENLDKGPLRWDKLTPSEWMPLTARVAGELRATGTAKPYEKEYLRPDGSRWWGLFAPRMLTEREAVEFILDITERKRAEQQLKRLAEAALAITAAGTIDDVLRVLTDEARELVGSHQAVVSLTAGENWSQAINHVSLSDKYAAWRDYTEMPTGSGIYSVVCRMNKPMRMTQQELEAHPAWKGFGSHHAQHPPMRGWLAVPLKAPDGRNLGLIQLSDKYDGEFTEADEAIIVQLAEMGSAAVEARRLTESLGKSNEQLARTNRELEEFAYVASHDLQEPLRMVNVYTQQLLRRFVPDHPDAYLFAKFIEQGVHRMQALIEDLLDFSRTVHASGAPAEAVADLGQSLNEAMTVLRNRIEESKAVIETEPLPTVFGDTNQLAHVFQNLLSNALKYRRQDVAPHIRISTTRSEKEWLISVSDNGIGFDPQYSERIFGLFKRLHKEAYPGTGLGLAICRRIVERYGGRMWAEGRPGHGATFHFALHPAVRTLDHVLPPGTQTSNTR